MGKTRETANITAENLVSTNITSDFLNVGTGITMYGGSVGIISATSFYGDGSNLTNLPASGISNVVEDTTPQLGGNLDINGKYITGTGGANITGVCTATSFVGDGSNLTGLSGGVTTGKAIAMAMVFG